MGSSNLLQETAEPIAIIGTACRFSGSLNSPSKLWEFLRKPKDVLTKIPQERFNVDAYYHPNGLHHGTSNVTESYLLQEDVRLFDSNFFNIKPIEAQAIDPQQRLLLEVVYESLEAAGMSMESMAGSQTGVYVGLMCGDYSEHIQRDIDSLPTYMATGTARSIISNRISYFFDWHGPSMTIDTACSSSLVAVHQAVQLLRSGDSNVAVAAGANLILGPELYIGEAKLNMLSPTGRSRMWDADANGYARGEGVASVILKRLSDAIRDGDHIECVIRESGVNSDGRTKGITMPNEAAQAELIRRVYHKAGLDPLDEAHSADEGVTTKEAAGISQAFFAPNDSEQASPLYVGSIKTTLGHTEGTAGLAGLIKSSLALQNSTIPPNLLFDNLSPSVEPFYGNLQIVRAALPWPKVTGPRRASVNSFGFGGTNAHVILESFAGTAATDVCDSIRTPSIPFVFSAASETALAGALESYSAYLESHPEVDLVDLAYTLSSRRSALSYRASFSATTSGELKTKLDEHLAKSRDNDSPVTLGSRPDSSAARVLGVFTGQGAQWAGMGRELVLGFKYARDVLKDLEATLSSLPNETHRPSWSLTGELLAGSAESRVGEARISQPLCTAVQILLADLLKLAGVKFTAVIGHSSGEIGAAYAAGFISRSDAIKIAYYRGLCTEESRHIGQKGAMMAITNNDVLRVGFAMSGLPGWWLGKEEGRRFSPCVSSMEWHDALLKTGFSGIDTLTPEVDVLCRPLSVIVSQAVDE
ncbi:putative PKS/NRPS-like protein biosynthetic cluster [Diaporthe eres]